MVVENAHAVVQCVSSTNAHVAVHCKMTGIIITKMIITISI